MRTIARSALVVSLLLGATPSARALGVAAKVGTLGFGVEVSKPLGTHLNARLGVFGFSEGLDYATSGIDYQGDLDLLNGTLLLDWFPTGGGFHLTVGLAANDSSLTGRAPLSALVGEGDLPPDLIPMLDQLGRLEARAEVNPIGPYVGLGWGHSPKRRGWGLALDLGVIFQGSPEVRLKPVLALPLADFPGAQAILDGLVAQEEAEFEAAAEDFRYYPVISFGVVYRSGR